MTENQDKAAKLTVALAKATSGENWRYHLRLVIFDVLKGTNLNAIRICDILPISDEEVSAHLAPLQLLAKWIEEDQSPTLDHASKVFDTFALLDDRLSYVRENRRQHSATIPSEIVAEPRVISP